MAFEGKKFVFLIHSSEDKNTAEEIREILENDKIPCWIAPRDIPAGSTWAEAIIEAIEGCEVALLVLTKNSVTSPHVKRELDRAVHNRKKILALQIGNLTVSKEYKAIEFYLSTQQILRTAELQLVEEELCADMKSLIQDDGTGFGENSGPRDDINIIGKKEDIINDDEEIEIDINPQSYNPYVNRKAIKRYEEFYGRTQIIDDIFVRINSSEPQSSSIIGDRRIGKSSLLYHLQTKKCKEKHVKDIEKYQFFYLDMQYKTPDCPERFYEVVIKKIKKRYRKYLEINVEYSFEGLGRIIEFLNNENIVLILLLDEFEVITDNKNFPKEFFSNLRALPNRHKMAYITATRKQLGELCHDAKISESPFFNIFASERLSLLSKETACELIKEPAIQVGVNMQDYIEQILALGGRHPFFLQIACSVYFTLIKKNETDKIDQNAHKKYMKEAINHYNYIINNVLVEQEKIVVEKIVNGEKITIKQWHNVKELVERGILQEIDENKGVNQEMKLFSDSFKKYYAEKYVKKQSWISKLFKNTAN